jgi:hypothetical protein
MEQKNLRNKLTELKDQTWQLARESLDQDEASVYRTLTEFAERLTKLIGSLQDAKQTVDAISVPNKANPNTIPIFSRYLGTKYEAQLDVSRINGGRGQCVFLDRTWKTASGAAHQITHSQVNGWRFWKYIKEDGSIEAIEELKKVNRS